jgi:hypothetical protein
LDRIKAHREDRRKLIACWPGSELIMDWYHLGKKFYELTSLTARGGVAKKALLGQLLSDGAGT